MPVSHFSLSLFFGHGPLIVNLYSGIFHVGESLLPDLFLAFPFFPKILRLGHDLIAFMYCKN